MEVGEETDSKDLLPSAPPTTTGNPSGRAPGVYAANAAEVCYKEQGEGGRSPTPNTCVQGQHRVSCHWSVQVHLSKLCDFGNIPSGYTHFLV